MGAGKTSHEYKNAVKFMNASSLQRSSVMHENTIVMFTSQPPTCTETVLRTHFNSYTSEKMPFN